MPPFAFRSNHARRTSLLLAGTVYVAGGTIAAAEPSEPIASASLELDADPSCATRADLIERVRVRSPRVRFVVDGSGLAIRVQISATASGAVSGEVTLANPGTKSSTRHVPAQNCSEVVNAVALIIAVTLDPTFMEHGAATNGENRGASSTNRAGENSTEGAASSTAPVSKQTSNGSGAGVSIEPEGDSVAPTRATFAGQLAAEGIVGVAPGVMPALALFATVGVERESVWSPSFVLGVRRAWRSDVEAPGGSASFVLDAATLDICPARLRRGVVEVRPCGSTLFGRLSAEGADTFNPGPESVRPFWALGGAAVVTANLVGVLQVSGRFAVGANLVRDAFEFNPTTFHEVPPLSASASVGVGAGW